MNRNIARLLHSYPRLYIAWLRKMQLTLPKQNNLRKKKKKQKKKPKRLERFSCCVQFGCENSLLHMSGLSGLRRHTAAMIMLVSSAALSGCHATLPRKKVSFGGALKDGCEGDYDHVGIGNDHVNGWVQ